MGVIIKIICTKEVYISSLHRRFKISCQLIMKEKISTNSTNSKSEMHLSLVYVEFSVTLLGFFSVS